MIAHNVQIASTIFIAQLAMKQMEKQGTDESLVVIAPVCSYCDHSRTSTVRVQPYQKCNQDAEHGAGCQPAPQSAQCNIISPGGLS